MRPDARATRPARPTFLEEDSNGWLVTFSDLVLQLFAFIVVAAVVGHGVSLPSPGAAISLQVDGAERTVPAVPAAPAMTAPDALSLARFEDLPPPAPAAAVAVPVEAAAAPVATVPEPELAVVAAAPAGSLAAELETFVRAAGLADAVQVTVNGGGVTLTISDTIGFASGSAELLADAAPVLGEIRGLLDVRTDLAVEVAGHTDDVPVHGGAYHSNLELSLARAARVARELAAGDASLTPRIFAAGYGEQRPIASNGDAEGRARNRRVEIRLVPAAA